MKSLIADIKVGQNIVFKDIQAIGPDGRQRNLSPIVLTIRWLQSAWLFIR